MLTPSVGQSETKGYNILCLHNQFTRYILCFLSLTFFADYYILCTERFWEGIAMDINGLQKLTLLDYPGKVACTVFLAGCNLRCPFCHNASLVLGGAPTAFTEEELLRFLKKRAGFLEGVCITGGEPTLRPGLPEFLAKIKALGYAVKLDTNGTNPGMVRKLIADGLVDYVAMDIKNAPSRYRLTCGGVDVLDAAKETAALLMAGTVDYEFRTTCVRGHHDVAAMEEIGDWIAGAKAYYLQNFVDSGDLIGSGVSGLTQEEMGALRQAVLPWIANTRIRGL